MSTGISKTYTGINGGVYTLIQNLEQFKNFIELAKANKSLFATDTETNGFSYIFNSACGISIGWGSGNNYYLPINHIISDIETNVPIEQLNLQDILLDLQELYGDPNRTWILQNSKFDLHHLRKLGIEVKGTIHDLLPMTFLLDENDSHALKDCAVKYMHKDADKWEKIIKEWRVGESKRRRKRFSELLKEKEAEYLNDIMFLTKVPVDLTPKQFAKLVAKEALKDHPYQKNKLDEISYDMIPLELMTPYASSDVHYTLILFKIFLTELVKDTNLKELYKNEMLLSNVLFETESHGIKVDKEYLTRIGPELDSKIAGLEKKIYKQVGHEFNLASPKQLAEVFQKLNIRLSKLSNKSKENMREGNYDEQLTFSVDSSVLEELAVKNPFVKDIVDLRSASKIKGTYVDGILASLDANDMVHSSFNANVTSGRMCVAAGSLVQTPCDRSKFPKGIPIEDIKEGDQVYSYDVNGKLCLNRVIWAGKTGHKPVVRIDWIGSGKKHYGNLHLTADHRVRTFDNKWVKAGDLKSNDRLTALSNGLKNGGYSYLYARMSEEIREHRFIADSLLGSVKGKVVHHKDGNKLNNTLDNLELMTLSEHSKEHTNQIPYEQLVARAGYLHTAKARAANKAVLRSGPNNSRWKNIPRLTLLRWAAICAGKVTAIMALSGMDHTVLVRKYKLHGIDLKDIRFRYGSNGHYISPRRLRFSMSMAQNERLKYLGVSYYKFHKLLDFYKMTNNHVVISVTEDGTCDVYDLEVENTHSFIANEICVHNSSKSPNLQNIGSDDKTIRQAFIVSDPKEYVYVLADLSQIELRILAHLSCDKSLLACYPFEGEGVDLHTLTLSEVVMQKPMNQILLMKENKTGHSNTLNKICECPSCTFDFYRKVSKTMNFSIAYGVSGKGLSPQVSTPLRYISPDQGDILIRRWFDKFNYVKLLFKEVEESIKKHGYVFNMFGRKRRFPDYWNSPKWMRSGMQRIGQNYIIQSSSADLFKQAVTRMYEEVIRNSKSKFINFVHDEVQLQVHKSELHLIPKLKHIFEDWDLKVPIKSDWSYSTTNWADKKPLPLDNLESIL